MTYRTHMQRDFPESERKSWDMTMELYRRGIYEMLEARSEGTMVGYIWMVCPPGSAVLIDYLAVLPQYRGAGIGGAILKALTDRYQQEGKVLLLESEYPQEAPDPQTACRRLSFYARCGFLQTGVQVRLFGVRFCILCQEKSLDARKHMEHIYASMFRGQLLRQAVEFI